MTDYSQSNKDSDTQLNSTVDTGKVISAVKLNKNKVFIAHSCQEGEYVYLYGTLCTISGTTIKLEASKWLFKWASSINTNISAVALNENKVFIAYGYGTSCYLYGVVCTISGTTITCGTSTKLSTVANTASIVSVVALDEGKVFIAHSYGSNYNLHGIVCTISGTAISKGTDTGISSIENAGQVISVVKLDGDKVFIAHLYKDTAVYLGGIVCTINGTTITKGTDTKLNKGGDLAKVISTVLLNNNTLFIVHAGSSTYELYAIVCNINGTTISKGTDTVLSSTTNTGKVISAVALNENTVNILHGDSNNYLYSALCDVSETTVVKKSDTLISNVVNSGSAISAVALSENNIFIGHSYSSSNYLYAMVLGYLANIVKTITSSTEKIGGVAITSGQDGEMVTTVRPDDILRATINATISTENYGSITFDNVELEHRKVLDNSNKVYSFSKFLTINETLIEFKASIDYSDVYKGWVLTWNFSSELYFTNTAKTKSFRYNEAIKEKIHTTILYTEPNKLGEKITITTNITI